MEFEEAIKRDKGNWELHYYRALALKGYIAEKFVGVLQEEGFDSEAFPLPDSPFDALQPVTDRAFAEVVARAKADPANKGVYGKSQVLELESQLLKYQSARIQTLHVVSWAKESLQAVQRLNPGHQPSAEMLQQLSAMGTPKQASVGSTSKGGCYIATACYGSFDHPDVIVLRRFRDAVLLKSAVGRLVVRVYYGLSPSLASKLGIDGICSTLFARDFWSRLSAG